MAAEIVGEFVISIFLGLLITLGLGCIFFAGSNPKQFLRFMKIRSKTDFLVAGTTVVMISIMVGSALF